MKIQDIVNQYDKSNHCNIFEFRNESRHCDGCQFAEFNAFDLDIYLEGDFSLENLENIVAALKVIKAGDNG